MYLEAIPEGSTELVISGDEARHALRVKRVTPGDHIELLDGMGTVAEALVLDPHHASARTGKKREWMLPVRVERVGRVEPVTPRVEVWSATPKGSRLEEMIDALSQVGAASWGPLATERGVVDPREAKLARVERVAVEASKQCGRAWVLRVMAKKTLGEVLRAEAGTCVVMADASGERFAATEAATIRLLIGPEGGWTEGEVQAARAAGAAVCSFGPHVMRIETAAVVGAGAIQW